MGQNLTSSSCMVRGQMVPAGAPSFNAYKKMATMLLLPNFLSPNWPIMLLDFAKCWPFKTVRPSWWGTRTEDRSSPLSAQTHLMWLAWCISRLLHLTRGNQSEGYLSKGLHPQPQQTCVL